MTNLYTKNQIFMPNHKSNIKSHPNSQTISAQISNPMQITSYVKYENVKILKVPLDGNM